MAVVRHRSRGVRGAHLDPREGRHRGCRLEPGDCDSHLRGAGDGVGIVAARGKLRAVRDVRPGEALFLVASGIATGASWLFFYYAIQTGQVSIVVQIDKLSIVVSIAFAWLFLHERLSWRAGLGLALIVCGTALMTAFP